MIRIWGAALLVAMAFLGAALPAARAEESENELTDAEMQEMVQFVYGNAMFVLIHEAGHMLISELELPVLGREEDAVDTLSSILLLEARDETLDTAITDSADGWFLSSDLAAETGSEQVFWDSHGLDQQRAFQMVCMMVGQDAEGFKEFADSVDFPQSRREECPAEYEQAKRSWFSLLAPHVMPEGGKNSFEVSYEEPADKQLAGYATIVKETRMLETLADVFGELYKLEDGIRFTAASCGQPNAFWIPGERRLVYCYELAQYNGALITKWLVENRDSGEGSEEAGSEESN